MSAKVTRDQIVTEADRLFYENGFGHTSFADIAGAVKISRGNFYYHFKTKDEILEAVIARRLANREAMTRKWELDNPDPARRIECFIKILIVNQTRIMAYGCPIGTLSAELAKLGHPLRDDSTKLFSLFITWLERQFHALGCGQNAPALAMQLFARTQGTASVANAFRDEDFVRREVEDMCRWVRSQAQNQMNQPQT